MKNTIKILFTAIILTLIISTTAFAETNIYLEDKHIWVSESYFDVEYNYKGKIFVNIENDTTKQYLENIVDQAISIQKEINVKKYELGLLSQEDNKKYAVTQINAFYNDVELPAREHISKITEKDETYMKYYKKTNWEEFYSYSNYSRQAVEINNSNKINNQENSDKPSVFMTVMENRANHFNAKDIPLEAFTPSILNKLNNFYTLKSALTTEMNNICIQTDFDAIKILEEIKTNEAYLSIGSEIKAIEADFEVKAFFDKYNNLCEYKFYTIPYIVADLYK